MTDRHVRENTEAGRQWREVMSDTKKRVARLKLRHLSVIHAVGREGSLQKAGEHLALTQSAMSKTLSEAEAIMEAQLFERTPLGSRATLLGEVLVRYSAKVMAELERAGDEFEALEEGDSGTLTVGIFTPIGWWGALSRAVSDFQAVAPRVKLSLRQASMEDLMPALQRGDIDVVIGRTADQNWLMGMCVQPLFDDGGPRFVARAGHPLAEPGIDVTLADLVRFPWFLPEGPSVLLTALQVHVRNAGLPWPNRVIYSHVYTVNLAICAKSSMIALLPGFTIAEVGAVYGLRQLAYEPSFNAGPLAAIWRADRTDDPAVQKFVERLKGICDAG